MAATIWRLRFATTSSSITQRTSQPIVLLAEATFEKGDQDSAAELYRRVLSADPEDPVAYTSLATIFQRQGLISEAAWHLERAYELVPDNMQTRKDLLRLYAERDGKYPSRLRLTPGALARLYFREGLFTQAISEFRTIASESPRRLDARVALAEALWRADQVHQSSQVAQDLLQALPYCLKANLIPRNCAAGGRFGGWRALPPHRRRTGCHPSGCSRIAGRTLAAPDHGRAYPVYVEGALPPSYEEPAEEPSGEVGFEEWLSQSGLSSSFADDALAATEAEGQLDFSLAPADAVENPAAPSVEPAEPPMALSEDNSSRTRVAGVPSPLESTASVPSFHDDLPTPPVEPPPDMPLQDHRRASCAVLR